MTAPIVNLLHETFRIEKMTHLPAVPRHKHTCYELFFILQGEGNFYIDCEHYDVQKNSIFFVAPGRIHGWNYTNNIEAYLIKCDLTSYLDPYILEHLSVFHFDTALLSEQEASMITGVLDDLYKEFLSTYSLKDFALTNLLNILFVYLQRALPAKASAFTPDILMTKLDDLMYQNNYQLSSGHYYAKKLKVSLKHLNTAVKKFTGISCSEYIRSKTLYEAQRLLKYDTLTCNEIADRLGFIDPCYFSRFFKREFGIAPKFFRNDIA